MNKGTAIPGSPDAALIGREAELQIILAALQQPDRRLLSLIGAGGSGKTALALEVAAQAAPHFREGATVIYLQAVEAADYLAIAIADALDIPLREQFSVETQLINALRGQQRLLLLDNCEHLLEGTPFLLRLLADAPQLTLLLTSREALNLRGEWRFPVEGLAYPPPNADPATSLQYPAVQLFVKLAQRVQPDFSAEANAPAIAEICRYLEGMPLAIELAAAWVRSLPCTDIQAELMCSLDFLESTLRDVPSRHRSLRAVFDQSWAKLDAAPQELLSRLSIFRGGFRRETAEAVAGASLPVLSTLMDQSLLKMDSSGRYHLHEMLRQYSYEKLRASGTLSEVEGLHAEFLAAFIAQHSSAVYGRDQYAATEQMMQEMDNLRACWREMLRRVDRPLLLEVITGLSEAIQQRGRFREGRLLYEEADAILQQHYDDRAAIRVHQEVLVCLGWFYIRLGQIEDAESLFHRSQDIIEGYQLQGQGSLGNDPLIGLAMVRLILGDYEDVTQIGERVRSALESQQDSNNLMLLYYVLAGASYAQGQFAEAQQHAQRATYIARRAENRWFTAYCLHEQGLVARAQGDYIAAQRYFQESFTICESFRDPEGMAVALLGLAQVAWLQEQPQLAYEQFQHSMQLSRRIGDLGGIVSALQGLGCSAINLERYTVAQQTLLEALHLTQSLEMPPRTLAVLRSIGTLLSRVGAISAGITLLQAVAEHPNTDHESRIQAQLSLRRCRVMMLPLDYDSACQEGKNLRLGPAVQMAEAALLALHLEDAPTPEASPPPQAPASASQDAMPEALSERELEILRLLAEGLTNQQIAEKLIVATGTVKAHNHNIFAKLGVRNRVQALRQAQALALV